MGKKRLELEQVIEKFKVAQVKKDRVDRYDYSKVKYVNTMTKVEITCIKHGVTFMQSPNAHMVGKTGCNQCSGEAIGDALTMTLEEFLVKALAQAKHKDIVTGEHKYTYEKVIYLTSKDKIIITCKKHGDFTQIPGNHLFGQGCPECGDESAAVARRSNTKDFVKDSQILHPGEYLYHKVNYVNNSTPVEIYCKICEEYFWQRPDGHLNKKNPQGCMKCGIKSSRDLRTRSVAKSVILAEETHGKIYDYSLVIDDGVLTEVDIICPKEGHGIFRMSMAYHINGKGKCPKCCNQCSAGQIEVEDYIKSLDIEVVRDYKLKDRTEIDIYIPTYNLGFDYDGLYWHGDKNKDKEGMEKARKRHKIKTLQAESEGIRLVHIFEDEWLLTRPKIENLIKILLNKNTIKYNARDTKIKRVEWKDCSIFLENNHLQGSGSSSIITYGLYLEDHLISVMCFSTAKTSKEPGCIELVRFCSVGNVRGGFSKLLKYFIDNHPCFTSISSFSDKRWSNGNIYKSSGFEYVHTIPPDYYWCKGLYRSHKSNFRRSCLPKILKEFDPEGTEESNCREDGFHKIWDCGKDKWVLKINR